MHFVIQKKKKTEKIFLIENNAHEGKERESRENSIKMEKDFAEKKLPAMRDFLVGL